MKLNMETIRQTYRLKNIVRYNPWSKVSNESVAEHSYYVVLFTMLLCKDLDVKKEIEDLAIRLAVIHDLPEIITNDITYDAKQALPEVAKLLQQYETKFYKDNFGVYQEIFRNSRDVAIASLIVKMADIISAIQYCDNEVRLGNEQFIDILANNVLRLEDIKNTLERNDVSCQKIMI